VGNKQKGSSAERELIHLFWKTDWAATRVAGSGSMQYPSPDIIAHRPGISLAIECKATRQTYKYLEKEEIQQLIEYSIKAGITPLIAVRFPRQPWYFLSPEQLKETEKFHMISLEEAQKKGKTFETLTKGL